jgi:hypothetical protein
MKIISLLLSLCLASVALAEEPAELTELRQTWEKERSEAQGKVDKLYLEELEGLKENFTKAGNIADALAVDNVIKEGDRADNEPQALTKVRLARDKSLKKVSKPLDKRYWQDLLLLKDNFQKQGNLDGVVAADAEIEKVLVAYKAKPQLKLKRRTVAVIEQRGQAGDKHSNNIYEFELKKDVKGAVVKMWISSHWSGNNKLTFSSNGLVTVVEPDGRKIIAYEWTSEKLGQARNNSANPKFKDAYLVEFDAEKIIKAKGNYKIGFSYKSGKEALRIEKVEITART